MSATLNAVTTADSFDQSHILVCPGAVRVRLQIFNQPVAWRFGTGSPPNFDEPEAHLTPGLYSFDQLCDAIQVRSWVPLADLPAGQTQAIVTAQLLVAAEVGGDQEADDG
jgi:hypothetical protein